MKTKNATLIGYWVIYIALWAALITLVTFQVHSFWPGVGVLMLALLASNANGAIVHEKMKDDVMELVTSAEDMIKTSQTMIGGLESELKSLQRQLEFPAIDGRHLHSTVKLGMPSASIAR